MNLEKPKWPDGKKCAAMLTINLNAELFWLQMIQAAKICQRPFLLASME